jgi:HSP20 family protein
MEMPGVDKGDIDIGIENDAVAVFGRIDLGKYQDLMPVCTEYNIGNYRRSFALSSVVDRDKITASHENGVLKLTLPTAAAALPRKIAVS